MTVNTSTDQFTTDSSESPIIESSDNIDDSIISTTEHDTSDTSKEEDSIKQKISESTDKSPTKKIAKKSDDSDYFFFGYIPNYKIPIINLKISYPVDVIADNVR